jgi:hypothetical protein
MIKVVFVLLVAFLFTAGFVCNGGGTRSATNYDEIGKYAKSVTFYDAKKAADKYLFYYPEGHLAKAPIVLFLPGGNANIMGYRGIMQFIASHGYFVIGTTVSGEYSDYLTNIAFDKALAVAKKTHPEMDFSKLAVMGHSQGGGLAFPVMQHLLQSGSYGNNKNIVISIDGWFPFEMNQKDLRELKTMVSFIQFGGYRGTGTDPRITLTILNLINDVNEKAYITLNEHRHHSYSGGDLKTILTRKDLLKPIMALLDYKLKGDRNAKHIVLDGYKKTVEKVTATLGPIGASCKGRYNSTRVIIKNDIDYCHPELYKR